jgi:hypothetical protein
LGMTYTLIADNIVCKAKLDLWIFSWKPEMSPWYIVKSIAILALLMKPGDLAVDLILSKKVSNSRRVVLQSASESALCCHKFLSIEASESDRPPHSFKVRSTAWRKLMSLEISVQREETFVSALRNVIMNL